MTTRQDDLLKGTLRRMADRVGDADTLGERLAKEAVRGADRRRTRRIAIGTAGGVAVVSLASIAFVGVGHDGSGPGAVRPVASGSPTRPLRLPPNTASELALVRACMVDDPFIPGGSPTDPTTLTGPGTHVADFRILVTYHDARGQIVLLGSTAAHRECSLDTHGRPSPVDRTPRQTANTWQPGFSSFTGVISLDENGGDTIDGHGLSRGGIATKGIEQHVGGRVRPDVARVTFTMPDGRTTDAAVSHGFYQWRITKTGPVHGLSEQKPLIIRAYDRAGRLLTTVRTRIDAELARP